MMEPWLVRGFARELAELIRDERVYRHLHLPVQSGDDRVLKLMYRRYTVSQFKELVSYFRKMVESVSIATDVIVGYPGEDEGAFQNTVRLVEEVKFDKVHVARYTLRPFTPAYLMAQVPAHVKKARSKVLSEVVFRVTAEVNKRYVGSEAEALVTDRGFKGRGFVARLSNYKPVVLQEELKVGERVKVRIVDATPIYLIGRTLD